jgi:hypothetical protein
MSSRRFAPGDTATRRDVLNGKVWAASPHRVLHDTGAELLLAHWPGVTGLAPTTWTAWVRTGDDAVRKQGLPDLAAGRWTLEPWTWRDTGRLSWFGVDELFSVHRFFDVEGRPLNWYVNFERPAVRTPAGIDTCDLMLDLVATPDLESWAWKDEDEYAQIRRLGLVGDGEHAALQRARERAVALIDTRGGPFREDWPRWRADANWPIPVLPDRAAVLD